MTTVTVLQEAATCFEAAIEATAGLRSCGAAPERLVDDLVSRGEIARRAGVTPQAVGLWIRGERQAQAGFPKPYVLGPTELWLWGEVVTALRARSVQIDDDVAFPTRRDIQQIGGSLAVEVGGEDGGRVGSPGSGRSQNPSGAGDVDGVAQSL